MKVLFVTSETAPIKKFGGLGDYSGSLPVYLQKLGVNIDIIMPYYSDAKVSNLKVYKSLELEVAFANATHTVTYFKTKLPHSSVDVILVRFGNILGRDFTSDAEYFAFFDRCVVEYISAGYNTYNLVHCNDWHTGFITHMLEEELAESRPRTLLTIHNLAYQGVGSVELVHEIGLLPGHHPLIDWDISDGNVNMLLQGLGSSDYLCTVSRSYAKELLTPEFGGDMTELLTQRSSHLIGILNGIDYKLFPRDFDENNALTVKGAAKHILQEKLGLEVSDKPLCAFVSRLDAGQKGLDILFESIDSIIKQNGQFVLLGTGDKVYEEKFNSLMSRPEYKGLVSVKLAFDVNLANEIYKACDFFLVPSKYEPCGLTQMMAMWYGSLPIVHNVGGLKDTVSDNVNGFVFDNYLATSLQGAIHRALDVYMDKLKFQDMVEHAMHSDYSWTNSAKDYKALYERIIGS